MSIILSKPGIWDRDNTNNVLSSSLFILSNHLCLSVLRDIISWMAAGRQHSNYAFTKAYLIVKKQKEIPTTPIYEPPLNAYYI